QKEAALFLTRSGHPRACARRHHDRGRRARLTEAPEAGSASRSPRGRRRRQSVRAALAMCVRPGYVLASLRELVEGQPPFVCRVLEPESPDGLLSLGVRRADWLAHSALGCIEPASSR